MDARVKKLIEEQEEKLRKEKEEAKERLLQRLGFGKRKYVEEDEVKINGSSKYEYDAVAKRFYLKEQNQEIGEPVELSDEDYEELLKYFPLKKQDTRSMSKPAVGALGIMAYIILILGLIGAIGMGVGVGGGDGIVLCILSCFSVMLAAAFMISIDKILENIKAIREYLEKK